MPEQGPQNAQSDAGLREVVKNVLEAMGRLKGRIEELEKRAKKQDAAIESARFQLEKQSSVLGEQAKQLGQFQQFLERAFRGGSPAFEQFLAELDEQVAKEKESLQSQGNGNAESSAEVPTEALAEAQSESEQERAESEGEAQSAGS